MALFVYMKSKLRDPVVDSQSLGQAQFALSQAQEVA